MASSQYNHGLREIVADYILASTIKMMLVLTGYVPDRDHDFIDEGGANDPVDHELSVAGYVGGWGGSGRKTLASVVVVEDDANNRVYVDCADITWTGLAAGATIVGMVAVVEGVADDLTSVMLSYLDITDTPTNNGDITAQINAAGFLQWSTA